MTVSPVGPQHKNCRATKHHWTVERQLKHAGKETESHARHQIFQRSFCPHHSAGHGPTHSADPESQLQSIINGLVVAALDWLLDCNTSGNTFGSCKINAKNLKSVLWTSWVKLGTWMAHSLQCHLFASILFSFISVMYFSGTLVLKQLRLHCFLANDYFCSLRCKHCRSNHTCVH